MAYMLLILEPRGQRAERGLEAGKQVYAQMLGFAEALKQRGVLQAVESLATDATATLSATAAAAMGVNAASISPSAVTLPPPSSARTSARPPSAPTAPFRPAPLPATRTPHGRASIT